MFCMEEICIVVLFVLAFQYAFKRCCHACVHKPIFPTNSELHVASDGLHAVMLAEQHNPAQNVKNILGKASL